MRRRSALLVLVALLLLPVAPAQAADPEAASPAPSVAPSPAVEASPSVEPSATAEPSASAAPSNDAVPSDAPVVSDGPDVAGGDVETTLDPSGRFIVLTEDGSDAQAVGERHRKRDGVKVERTFKHVGAFTSELTPGQRKKLEADPDVVAVVPDEIIESVAQSMPTGVARIGGRSSAAARIDGVDQRVDADVAIVDTGIDPSHPDLNVVGGINCSSSDRSRWYDENGHGTHVAGTVAALDDDYGVVGMAPGARLWAVRILGADGSGLLSWYLCGLDWIAAQRDARDPSLPMIEAVNMSVAKWGSDDRNCGLSNNDVLHQAICRVTAAGVTVVAAAANDAANAALRVPAAYDEVITVSALADMDGRPGGTGGAKCYSWGTYDEDDTFASFSNYGADVDFIAPGKCIWSTLPGNRFGWSSGTSMAAPHVTGAVALYKASRPWATTAEVVEALHYLGNYNWATSTDPDGRADRLIDVSRIGPYGDFSLAVGSVDRVAAPGDTVDVPVTIQRSASFFERVALSASSPNGVSVSFDRSSVYGFENASAVLRVSVPATTAGGTYSVTVTGTEHGRTRQATVRIAVIGRLAGADRFATAAAVSGATFGPGVPVAYIANAFNFPDALAAAAAAGVNKGPVLYAAPSGTLNAATAAELGRLKPGRIVVLGSAAVVGDDVVAQLRSYTAGGVQRLAGSDRFGTAATISAATFAPAVSVAYIANAFTFPDALAAAAAAGTLKGPVLYAAPSGTLNASTAAELTRLKPGRIVVLGSAAVVGDGVATQLARYTSGGVTRLAGADRFATAAAISAATFAPGASVAYIASAFTFPDALAGAAAAGTLTGPVLYAALDGPLNPATAAELGRLRPARIVVLGSAGVIGDSQLVQLAPYTGAP